MAPIHDRDLPGSLRAVERRYSEGQVTTPAFLPAAENRMAAAAPGESSSVDQIKRGDRYAVTIRMNDYIFGTAIEGR